MPTYIGLDLYQTGTYTLVATPETWNYDRTILYNGTRYEHVDTDADGNWCYRYQP